MQAEMKAGMEGFSFDVLKDNIAQGLAVHFRMISFILWQLLKVLAGVE